MKTSLLKTALAVFMFFLALPGITSHAQAAPKLTLDPAAATVVKNSEFEVRLLIDVETNNAFGADAVINYPGADIDLVSATNGGFFSDFNFGNTTSGRLELHGWFANSFDSKTGSGTMATIRFKAKKDAGSGTLTFTCTGSGTDTQIINTGGQNILTCTQLNQTALTYSAGSGTQPTSTPTTAPGNPTATPTKVPGSGSNAIPTCASLSADVTTSTRLPQAITFTCTGIDPDGYIEAAEIIFGDRTSQVVEKNAGSPGAISITHTYTLPGTMGASCRVRDNNHVWSQTPETCKKIITIKTSSGIGQSSQPIVYATVTPRITPTPPVVEVIPEDPGVPDEDIIAPSETPPAEFTGERRINPWVIIGILAAALFLILLILRRGKKSEPPHAPPYTPPATPPGV